MNFFRKNLFSISACLFLAFFTVLGVETFHHHGDLEAKDNCSLCSWQMTGSQATTAPAPPLMFPVVMACILYIAFTTSRSFTLISPSGRSPPDNLL